MKAQLIGETSAGMTAIEIYNSNGDLVWSHMYFADGATAGGYIDGLSQVYDDLTNCADVEDYDGCDYDEEGNVVCYDDSDTTGVIATFDSEKGWELSEDFYIFGQSVEIIDALMAAGIIEKDDDHEDRFDDVAAKIAEYIKQ